MRTIWHRLDWLLAVVVNGVFLPHPPHGEWHKHLFFVEFSVTKLLTTLSCPPTASAPHPPGQKRWFLYAVALHMAQRGLRAARPQPETAPPPAAGRPSPDTPPRPHDARSVSSSMSSSGSISAGQGMASAGGGGAQRVGPHFFACRRPQPLTLTLTAPP